MSSNHRDYHQDELPGVMGVHWGMPAYYATMSGAEACVFFCDCERFWELCYEGEMDPTENGFDGEIMRDELVRYSEDDFPGMFVRTTKLMQLKLFTDKQGEPKGIPGYRGLHAILHEISTKKTRALLSLNRVSPDAILKMRVSLLLAESLETFPVPAKLERSISSCVLDIAAHYIKDQKSRERKRKSSLESSKAVGSDHDIGRGNTNHVFDPEEDGEDSWYSPSEQTVTMTNTEACVFYVDWNRLWSKWHLGEFVPYGSAFEGTIMKGGKVLTQFASFTDESGHPKRIPGFQGLHAILDEISDDKPTLPFERCAGCIKKTRMSLWLAEMMQTTTLRTDRHTLSRVENAISTLDPGFDWDGHFGSEYIHLLLVFKVIGGEYGLPTDVLDSIATYLLPDKLKCTIAKCIFQLAVQFHEKVKEAHDSDDDSFDDTNADSDDDSDGIDEDE